jgi:hypothetical protein
VCGDRRIARRSRDSIPICFFRASSAAYPRAVPKVALSRAPERSAGPKARPLRSHRAAQTGGVRGAREIGMDELFARAGFAFSPKRQRWKWNPRRSGASRRCSGRSDPETRSGRRGTPKFKAQILLISSFPSPLAAAAVRSCGNPARAGRRRDFQRMWKAPQSGAFHTRSASTADIRGCGS